MLMREGTTPARLRQLREAIPTSRKFTKTDLAKYLNAWEQQPHYVSLGSQKNFERFMADLTSNEPDATVQLPDVSAYKQMIAKAIVFKRTQSLVRPMFQAFQANVTAYLVSLLANRLGQKLDLEFIWTKQDISDKLRLQLQNWAPEVNAVLHESAGGRMISEWAKRPECWSAIRDASYSAFVEEIPEVR
jgi:hypothetical protein